jgi:hypothetical protein
MAAFVTHLKARKPLIEVSVLIITTAYLLMDAAVKILTMLGS